MVSPPPGEPWWSGVVRLVFIVVTLLLVVWYVSKYGLPW